MPSDIAVLCTGDAVKAGTPVSTGTKICNEATLGDLALSADFSTTGLSDDLIAAYPSNRVTDIHEAATLQGGTAILHSSGSEQEAGVAPARWLEAGSPADTVVVVDFKQLSAHSTLGFSPRCSADACVLIALDGDGKYRFGVRSGRTWTYPLTGDLNGDTGYPAPRLDPANENRLIVWLSHGTIGGSLNGRELGDVSVKSQPVKEAFLFFRGLDQSKSSEVALTRIFFFAAAA